MLDRLPPNLDAIARWTTLVMIIGATAISSYMLGTANGLSTAVYQADDVRAVRDHAESLRTALDACLSVQERAVGVTEAAQVTFAAAWARYRAALVETDYDDLREVDDR